MLVFLFATSLAVLRPGVEGSSAIRCKQGTAAIAFAHVGMEQLCSDVYAEQPLTQQDRDTLVETHDTVQRRLRALFGSADESRVLTLFCRTAACKVAFGADPSSARAADLGFARDVVMTTEGPLMQRAVVVSAPTTRTGHILMHESVHARMKSWAPYDALPTWFNEGLATALADEPSCANYAPSSDFDVAALTDKAAWQEQVAQPGMTLPTYCQARFAVEAWAGFAPHSELAVAARAAAQRVVAGESVRFGD